MKIEKLFKNATIQIYIKIFLLLNLCNFLLSEFTLYGYPSLICTPCTYSDISSMLFCSKLEIISFFCRLAGLNSLDLYHEEYLHFISQYKFIIAIENAVCDDYITEKLWRPLIVGAVPIYFGSPTVEVMYFLSYMFLL